VSESATCCSEDNFICSDVWKPGSYEAAHLYMCVGGGGGGGLCEKHSLPLAIANSVDMDNL